MDKLLLCLLVVVTLPGAFSQGNTYRKAFVFPTESDTSYVTLFAPAQKPLKAFTVCLQAYTDLTRPPNFLNWQDLKYEIRGEVFLKNQLWP
ncbi:C-reactive protein isoform X3 [Ursus maritimus]|uniref:C-reactive protein isoform X3 n=1 Tax=Ursus maritimus TaxID=29073 RepID=A0A8M1G4F3_URSMA|nr:C-reactive protein isoform X3 [Ursus maritimus]